MTLWNKVCHTATPHSLTVTRKYCKQTYMHSPKQARIWYRQVETYSNMLSFFNTLFTHTLTAVGTFSHFNDLWYNMHVPNCMCAYVCDPQTGCALYFCKCICVNRFQNPQNSLGSGSHITCSHILELFSKSPRENLV